MEWVSKNKGFRLLQSKRWWAPIGLLALFAALAAVVTNFSWGRYPTDIRVGSIASHDIRADRDYEIIDEEATEKLRQDKLKGVLPVFDWDDREISKGSRSIPAPKVVADRGSLSEWEERGILIHPLSQPAAEPVFFKEWQQILTPEEAKKRHPYFTGIHPNLDFNQKETELRKEKVLQEIRDVVIKIQRGESIVRKGDRIEPWHVKVIRGIQTDRKKGQISVRWIGSFGFTFLFVGLLLLIAQSLLKRFKLSRTDYIFQGALMLSLLMIERLFLYFSGGIRELLPFEAPLPAFYVLLPILAGPMIVRLALSAEAAFLFSFGLSALASLPLENSIIYALYFFTGGTAVVWFCRQVKSRSQLLKMGLQLGILNFLVLLMLNLAKATSLGGVFPSENVAVFLSFAFLGGIASAVLTLILLPVVESIFNYVTSIKLLEFGSLNHPLLREMIVHAPGTYHHSHMVGTLAEAACEAIGADGLFARVASYFHDIGKLAKPPYFIENQRAGGEDRHSALTPSMSALIISSHVKDGMELAKKHNLPKRIIDIIPQHQGTKLISYFYSKAKQAENPEVENVDERHYRYPGPRPQTREAGIILLADTVEASTRALKDRTSSRIEEVVRNMINKNFVDGQLDECELTLRDLEVIGKVFARILVGIYHQRIEYPELPRSVSGNLSVVPPHVDKYTQPSPLKEDSLSEAPKTPPKTVTRLRTE